jgi:S-adenosylmethionine decarboxylase
MYCGKHIIVDFWGDIDSRILTDENLIKEAFITAAETAGATVLGSNWHHFGEGFGVTGVVMLSESHMSIHTWPEHGLATIDVYMCGTCEPMDAVTVLSGYFKPNRITTNEIYRGVMSEAFHFKD